MRIINSRKLAVVTRVALPIFTVSSSPFEISSYSFERIRTEHEQKRETWRFAGLGLLAGILLWSILPCTIARAMPESWQLPERMARKAVGEPTIVEAGMRMIESQNPDGFEELMAAHRLLSANREALEQCIKKSRKEERPVSCSITTLP